MIKTFAVAGTTALGLRAAARALLRKVQANPDPYPVEVLRRDLAGDEGVITRPDGTLLRVVAAGRGPTVVLAHGYGVTAQEWNVIWNRLIDRGHRVIAFDQRGHGRSTLGTDGSGSKAMASDYAAVLEHYDVQNGILVGHSMGGFLAIRALIDDPGLAQRLSGLVLVATWAGRMHDGAPLNWLQVPMLRFGIAQWLTRTTIGGTLFCATQLGPRPSPAMITAFRELFARQHHRALLPIVRAFMREDRYPRLREIALPTAVIVGEYDRTTPRSHAQRLAAGIPKATLTIVPNAGHCLNWETDGPATLIEAIESMPHS